MRSHRVAAALLLLLVAGALAVSTLRDDRPSSAVAPEASSFRSASAYVRTPEPVTPGEIPAHPAHFHRVEPLPPADAADLAQARQTEAHARRRLEELDTLLGLSAEQQDAIFPLLVRAAPHYDESLRLAGAGRNPGHPLNHSAAQDAIHALLDPYQQVELELESAETDLWWSSILARLEQDLNNGTDPAQLPAAGTAPPAETPPPPPVHRGGNLFERLHEETP